VALAAIRTAHLLAGRSIDLRHPRLAMVLEGVTRSKGVRPRRQAAPAVPGLLRLMLAKRPAQARPLGAREAIVARETTVVREAIVARERAMPRARRSLAQQRHRGGVSDKASRDRAG
jgi:hypothetical protein